MLEYFVMRIFKLLSSLAVLGLIALLIYQIPVVNSRLSWRLDAAQAYARGVLNPVGAVPTAVPHTPFPTQTPTSTPLPAPTATPLPSPTPLPSSISLPAPEWEAQDANNCGPATLSTYLRFYGWEGDQFDIARVVKPAREDRNVNVEELIYFARNQAGWLTSLFRVGGDIELLKTFLANGIPVVIEEGYPLGESYWPNDDRWAGHYLLITGYDDATQTFTGQDTFVAPDRQFTYAEVDANWKIFNRVYILIYQPGQEGTVQAILGQHWEEAYNRQAALETAEAEIAANPQDAFAWFNLGSNLVYFERYLEAADAYDEARALGLPQRMLRYQFGPFFAYFHSLRTDDLLALTEYALQITPNAEEALLWHGWGLYRQGDDGAALQYFRLAYEANPTSPDAQYALEFMGASP